MNMTEEEFSRIYRFLKSRYGIDMSRKKEIISGRLENYVHAHGYRNYSDYIKAVETDYSGRMERELVNMLSTNHTYFMREFDHFDYLRKEVLPWLKQKEARNRDLAIWCGAASTGQEPYMLAMLLMDFFGLEHESWDTKVLATDISTEALAYAVEGIYREEQIRSVPEQWKRRFFKRLPGSDSYEVSREVKDQVIFRQFNLMDVFPFHRRMHVIFLRNVMIYFDRGTRRQLVGKIYEAMEPGGYLFIGKTETLERDTAPLQMIESSIFRKPL